MQTASPATAAECSGVVKHHLWVFYTALRSSADEVVSAAVEITGLGEEGSHRRGWGKAAGSERHDLTRNGSYSPHARGPAIPEDSLITAATAMLGRLLHENRKCGGDGRGHVHSLTESEHMQRINTLAQVITWYCWAAVPVSENTFDFSLLAANRQDASRQHRPVRRNVNGSDSKSTSSSHLIEDGQMAEKIFGVGVEAVVYASVSNINKGMVDAHATQGGDGSGECASDELCHMVRMSAFYMLVAALMRFRNSPFNVTRYLPVLFPEVDARDARVSHPLLTPLLWHREERIRAAAAALLSALLRKLSTNFTYAEEPQQKRQSFLSLASLSGRVLASIHYALLWATQTPDTPELMQGVCSKAVNVQNHRTGIHFSVFSVLVAVTPYNRCPQCREMVGSVLRMNVLRECLVTCDSGRFKAATAFLCEVLKSESLISVVHGCLLWDEENVKVEAKNLEPFSRNEPRCDGFRALVDSLLTHAAARVEVWRCVVQLSRLHPATVGAHFSQLITASRAVLRLSTGLEGTTCPAGGAADATLGECLRGWVHFMGYVWQPFDGQSADPALRPNYASHRATQLQKEQIVAELVLPVLRMAVRDSRHIEARRAALRCLAQVGDEYLLSLSDSARQEIIEKVVAATSATESSGRAEAFTTIGVWAWKYTALDSKTLDFVDLAVSCLFNDPCSTVRGKAAFALSNITSRLIENSAEGDGGDGVESAAAHENPLRQSPRHIQLLCEVALHAAEQYDDAAIMGHGIRIMSHLLGCLTFEELIAEARAECEEQQQVVAEAFFDTLLRFLNPFGCDAKLRWNASCALGFGLAREVVFDAEPKGATSAVERLCTVVCSDRIFKVRTQAASALARVPPSCLTAGRYATADLTPVVARALCGALREVIGDTTETYAQYKEQGALRAALRQGLSVMITGATSSAELQCIFAEFRTILVAEGLLG
ncbi:hypothetical protein, conserved [Trypanosoma brucei gambiense DAL972]|uniref:DUF4042 domain-containing protein n=1 Tax=Trypanosoma brucei gambiense (strain MHOM/CI/86/DAL972) TaxID=679716 RepID=D0A1C8_TRYB9|nr:hypothetical protein, conserved [Trypanosoma brucei gambiense DAL972]CBH15070.1 hypothetical protein, conserved [Trypanosoma brucei gambiense DAL972]|eukprot:XP_011777336.1 hypothetical protein, conserved [Trypanosoma brucei gambiense DAL972]